MKYHTTIESCCPQTIEDIDLYTGGLAEVPSKGAVVGPTFACLIGRQMFYYKSGDRYWYENDIPPSSFTKEQLNEIRKTTMARVICDNIKTVDFIQPNVFIESDPFLNALMPCDGNTVVSVITKTYTELCTNNPVKFREIVVYSQNV